VPPAIRKNGPIAVLMCTAAAFIVLLAMLFFYRGQTLMEEQLKSSLRETAAAAALQFDPAVIERVYGRAPLSNPDVTDLVHRLRAIRDTMPTVRYVYLMRRTAEPMKLQFVADADSLSPAAQLDTNGNGVIDPDEKPSYPGDTYDITDVPMLQHDAFISASVDQSITTDAWGKVISGYAPIMDAKGRTVAVLGIDMDAGQYVALTRSIFSPVIFLLVCVGALLFAAYLGMFLWRRRIETLQHIDAERSGMMLLASHQLGSPLTIFQWSLENIRDSHANGTLEQDLDEQLGNMDEAVNRLASILRNLRLAADVDKGTFPLQPAAGYLSPVIVSVLHEMADRLRARKQKVQLFLDGNLHLSFDHQLIAQVVRELLQNAMTFSPDGAEIEIRSRRVKDTAEVEVRDRGQGIPAADLPRIFGKFVRAANAHFSSPDGNGLGLYIIRGIVEKSGGAMRIRSTEGEGTSVVFSLPIEPASPSR
jgi:signal transduction histidine kinase